MTNLLQNFKVNLIDFLYRKTISEEEKHFEKNNTQQQFLYILAFTHNDVFVQKFMY